MEELKAKTERSGTTLALFEQDLSMINPEQKTSIISARLIQLNTDYGAAEIDRVAKESVWRSVQTGTLESLQVSSQGAVLQALGDRVTEAKKKLAELQTTKGPKNPEYQKAALQAAELEMQFDATRQNIGKRVETEYLQALAREELLKKEFLDTKAEFDLLNAKSFQYSSLKREADTDRGLYDELVRKIEEAGINQEFMSNSINISDAARPNSTPVYPNTRSNLARAFVFSLILGIAAALLSDKLDNTIRDPQEARLFLGTEVLGSLPMVRGWRGKLIQANRNDAGLSTALAKPANNSATRSTTGFEEAIRTLRNSVLLSTFDHPLKSVMFTSACPSEGKTTIAVHFAIAHVQQNHKTLLIDCDLRRPGVHTKLGVTPETGLAAALMNGLSWREKLIQLEDFPGLSVLPAGPSSRRCADLIGASLKQILAEADSEYDLVVVDSPPVLGFPEPLQMAAAVDGVVIVSVAGETNRKAVDSVLTTLRRLRANVLGLVLNEVSASTSDGYYYHGYYGKYYKYYQPERE
jgi:polysaccharide biosynthesis transport protein